MGALHPRKIHLFGGQEHVLGTSLAKLALAWCLKNPNVSTVITGASRVEQVEENMGAVEVVPQLTEDVMQKIEKILDNRPEQMEFQQ